MTFPLTAKVGADTSSFISSMSGASRGLAAFTGAAGLAGAAVGVGLVIALGASVSAAREFQVELVKLNTLVGIQVEQIEAWEGSIKDLGVETGRMPSDLARAMFAITSGGARGEEALDLLSFAAKASAQGLGDMTAIGRTATAMLQAFGDEGLTAEKAIDIMVATVREGNLEASSLAGAFSRVLGPAKELGSSVEDVGGFLATFTRLGGSTEEAATGLLNMFQLLIKPPKEAREAMLKYGISIEEVRDTLAEDGLPAALNLMKGAIGDNVDAMGEMIPSVRALIAFLNTAGLQGKEFSDITNRVSDSLGLNAEGFETWGDSADAVFTRFSAQMSVMGISIGDLLLPPLGVLIELMTRLTGAVADAGPKWKEFFEILGKTDAVQALSTAMEFLGITTEDTADNVSQLGKLISEATDEKLAENAGKQARRVSALRIEIEALKASIEEQVDLPFGPEKDVVGIVKMRKELEDLLVLQVSEGDALAAITEEQIRRSIAEGKSNVVIEESIVLSEEDVEAREKRLASIQGIVSVLQDELLVMREGQAALLDKQLVELNATPITRIVVALLLEEIEAEEALADAISETAREKDRAAKDEIRRLETLKAKREREEETRRRALERADLALLNAEMQEAKRIATDMAESIGSAFDSIIGGTKDVGEAFGDMVTEILRQLQRLLIQRTIVEPLLNLLLGAFGPSAPQTGGGTDLIVGDSTEAVLGTATLIAGPPSGQTVIVQQTIEIHNDMIDQQSGDTFIRKHAPRIGQILAEGVRESGDLAAALRQ